MVSIATWNINSVRLRIGLVTKLLERWQPDVLCLQETKLEDANFPAEALREAGWVDMGRIATTEHQTKKHIFCAPELALNVKAELRRMCEPAPVVGNVIPLRK